MAGEGVVLFLLERWWRLAGFVGPDGREEGLDGLLGQNDHRVVSVC